MVWSGQKATKEFNWRKRGWTLQRKNAEATVDVFQWRRKDWAETEMESTWPSSIRGMFVRVYQHILPLESPRLSEQTNDKKFGERSIEYRSIGISTAAVTSHYFQECRLCGWLAWLDSEAGLERRIKDGKGAVKLVECREARKDETCLVKHNWTYNLNIALQNISWWHANCSFFSPSKKHKRYNRYSYDDFGLSSSTDLVTSDGISQTHKVQEKKTK